MPKVAVLDEREIWAAGMSSLVRMSGFTIAGSWRTVADAEAGIIEQAPDILIVSAGLLHELGARISECAARPAIVIVVEPSGSLLDEASAVPFEGVIFRDTTASAVETCLNAIAAGHAWIDPAIVRVLGSNGSHHAGWKGLSQRQRQIASLAARGLSNKLIARRLHVSDGTVKVHMHHILSKLDVARREDLAALSKEDN